DKEEEENDKRVRKRDRRQAKLPLSPTNFEPLAHPKQLHKEFMNLPPYHKVTINTNSYALINGADVLTSSNVSINEMMIRFSGRSVHIVQIKNKPIPEGYKVLSLCESGYTYTFLPTSCIYPSDVEKALQQIGVGSYVHSGVIKNRVLAVFWQDNGSVTMLSTIHSLVGNEWEIEQVRWWPRETSTNATKVHAVFGSQSKKVLKIPKIIDDYNHYMNGSMQGQKEFRLELVWDLINLANNVGDKAFRASKPTVCAWQPFFRVETEARVMFV
ncbi:912_t:CDS:2, partial [Cetraspora pellucida]